MAIAKAKAADTGLASTKLSSKFGHRRQLDRSFLGGSEGMLLPRGERGEGRTGVGQQPERMVVSQQFAELVHQIWLVAGRASTGSTRGVPGRATRGTTAGTLAGLLLRHRPTVSAPGREGLVRLPAASVSAAWASERLSPVVPRFPTVAGIGG